MGTLHNDVNIFYSGRKEPIMSVSRLELIRSDMFLKVFKSLNICDGCRDPISVIIEGEQEDVISAAFSKLSRKSGVSIIQGY